MDELLPPLTSRNDVDLQLYALLAIVMREFVQSWYARVTADEALVAEILHTVAHCTRALEQRLRKLDLESLVLDEVPRVLDRHLAGDVPALPCPARLRYPLTCKAVYRAAHQQAERPPLVVDPREAYHALWPLPALSPAPRPPREDAEAAAAAAEEQLANETAYRQLLAQAVLAVLLPTEDLENPCLTALTGEIFSELVISNVVANKAAQPWLLFEAICILARLVEQKRASAASSRTLELERGPKRHGGWSVQAILLSVVQLALVVMTSIRLLAGMVAGAASLPPRAAGAAESHEGAPERGGDGAPATPTKVPVLEFGAWSFLGNAVEMGSRMPWLGGLLSLLQLGLTRGPGRLAGLDSTLDR